MQKDIETPNLETSSHEYSCWMLRVTYHMYIMLIMTVKLLLKYKKLKKIEQSIQITFTVNFLGQIPFSIKINDSTYVIINKKRLLDVK